MGSPPDSNPTTQLLVPPAIPIRRLFQPPDAIPASGGRSVMPSETGDTYINNTTPATAPVTTGALPPFLVAASTERRGNPLQCE